jgi:uncharacterized repeat protein (TIGR03847 family)
VPIHELNPLTHLVADAVGVPGKRTFFLQAASGADQITLLVEKEQVRALTERLEGWLEELAADRPEDPDEVSMAAAGEMTLREPLVPDFRVGQVIVAAELPGGDEEAEDDPDARDDPEGRIVHLVATRSQLRRLAEHGAVAVGRGRPPCPICGNAMNPEGHVCPAMNGHRPFATG